MKAEILKKMINGREIEYLDVIYHTTTTKFKFWDRIKILFGKEVVTSSEIYTQHEWCKVVGSESKTNVAPFIKRKSVGAMHSLGPENFESGSK